MKKLPEKPSINDMEKAVMELKRDTGQPSRKTFKQDVFFDRRAFYRLSIISVLEGEYRGKIGEMSINGFIKQYEAENGNLLGLAEQFIKENKVCPLCDGEGEIEDRTVSTSTGYLKGKCPKCGGLSK